ncbi:MAG TPA: hypothetical protein VK625_00130 [Flavitalea sp.]|nr:hypothetical protein [Flavitalea sp.]
MILNLDVNHALVLNQKCSARKPRSIIIHDQKLSKSPQNRINTCLQGILGGLIGLTGGIILTIYLTNFDPIEIVL